MSGDQRADDGAGPPADNRRPRPPCRKVIVAGYGLVGRCTAEKLQQAGIDVMIIEMNLGTIEKQLGLGRQVVYGDVADPDVLRRAGIADADALVLAVPDEDVALKACAEARRLAPEIFIAARTNFLSKGLLAQRAGADHVIVEEVVTAEAMRDGVMRHLMNHEPA